MYLELVTDNKKKVFRHLPPEVERHVILAGRCYE